MQNILQSLKTIALALILALGLNFAMAWTGPTQAPPGGNTSAPVNVGTSNQTKTGGLLSVFNFWVDGAMGVTGGASFGGNVGAGTTTPGTLLSVGNTRVLTSPPRHQPSLRPAALTSLLAALQSRVLVFPQAFPQPTLSCGSVQYKYSAPR